ncbi:hypothetical protein SARC_07430 [Sphaeroforma arctica JP610]|uniref:Uncharacterized protein n=1 Tax=Sphaeroforma arctica JP610 TaxID=667725 RepID=A0A0L0FU63_9EUKA|nr:hypothetical protein SARC_07430 [Sphaeroforma arctica JP610]KNC80204.1 hypothetical protein SARC_07430 [Sphaeroforma arctica JP610]|eukprot:XP_014154106.1 hypothetical protein SARC_07430 [Sphaeroforma arctica JP610]
MPINFAALDFLSPGLLEIELSDSRQVLYDQKYSLKVPTGPGQHREFWVALETPLQILDVGIYQTVEITVCFFRPSTGSKPMQVTTRRRVYTPAHYLLWCDFYPFSDQRQGLGLLTRANRLDMGYVRRIIVRLQCNTNMPDFWTEGEHSIIEM